MRADSPISKRSARSRGDALSVVALDAGVLNAAFEDAGIDASAAAAASALEESDSLASALIGAAASVKADESAHARLHRTAKGPTEKFMQTYLQSAHHFDDQ